MTPNWTPYNFGGSILTPALADQVTVVVTVFVMVQRVLREGRLGGIGEGRCQLAEASTWLWIVLTVC